MPVKVRQRKKVGDINWLTNTILLEKLIILVMILIKFFKSYTRQVEVLMELNLSYC